MRMVKLTILNKNEQLVFPRPFIILIRLLFVYKKGQIHANVIRKSPASLLWNIRFPTGLPVTSSPAQQMIPRRKQLPAAFFIIRTISSFLPEAWSSAIAGSIIDAIELVTAEGNKMQGKAIPVNTPYILSDSEVVMPYVRSCTGIDTASIL